MHSTGVGAGEKSERCARPPESNMHEDDGKARGWAQSNTVLLLEHLMTGVVT